MFIVGAFTALAFLAVNHGPSFQFPHQPSFAGTACLDQEAAIVIRKAFIAEGDDAALAAERTMKTADRCVDVIQEWGVPVHIAPMTVVDMARRGDEVVFIIETAPIVAFGQMPIFFLRYGDD